MVALVPRFVLPSLRDSTVCGVPVRLVARLAGLLAAPRPRGGACGPETLGICAPPPPPPTQISDEKIGSVKIITCLGVGEKKCVKNICPTFDPERIFLVTNGPCLTRQ